MPVQRWDLDHGERHQAIPNGPVARVLIGADAGWRAGLVEVTVPPGGEMPEHDHGASEVILIVRAGRARLIASDGVVTKLEPGVVVTIPVGERVRLENPEDEEARLSVVLTPPDFATAVAAWPAVT